MFKRKVGADYQHELEEVKPNKRQKEKDEIDRDTQVFLATFKTVTQKINMENQQLVSDLIFCMGEACRSFLKLLRKQPLKNYYLFADTTRILASQARALSLSKDSESDKTNILLKYLLDKDNFEFLHRAEKFRTSFKENDSAELKKYVNNPNEYLFHVVEELSMNIKMFFPDLKNLFFKFILSEIGRHILMGKFLKKQVYELAIDFIKGSAQLDSELSEEFLATMNKINEHVSQFQLSEKSSGPLIEFKPKF